MSQHTLIWVEDPPSAATPAAPWAGHVHFIPQLPPVSAVISVLQSDFGPSSPAAVLTLADLLGMADVLTYLLFQSRCLQGLFGIRTKFIPRPYAILSAGAIR